MSVIDIHSTIVMHGDGETATQNPQRRFVDWSRHIVGVKVDQPSVREYIAQPGELLNIFSGVRSTSIDGTTAFGLTLNPVKSSTYRMTHSAGTAPAFRTARVYAPSGVLHTLTVNNNSTLEMQIGAGNFNAQVGDTVFIPHTTTGDSASPFNVSNVGFWIVIGATATKMVLQRRVGEAFSGVSEAVTPTLNSQLIIFSATGVQVGDTMEVSGGFANPTQKSFVVAEVTADWVEFVSTAPLPLESGVIPTASGLVFYYDSKRFLRIETDQDAVVRLNGDVGSTNRLSPRVPGDPESVAHFEKWGPVWDLKVLNRSTTSSMVVTVISAE